MKKENLIQDKTYAFALRVIKLYKFLTDEKREFVLSKQLLRSGTSIGANVEEAIGGFSKSDFVAKLRIAYKEARESHYWIRLLRDSEYLTVSQAESLLKDLDQIIRIIAKIIISSRKVLKTKIKSE